MTSILLLLYLLNYSYSYAYHHYDHCYLFPSSVLLACSRRFFSIVDLSVVAMVIRLAPVVLMLCFHINKYINK